MTFKERYSEFNTEIKTEVIYNSKLLKNFEY